MEAGFSLRRAASLRTDHTKQYEDRLDREIDAAAGHLMMHSPSSQAYSGLMARIRGDAKPARRLGSVLVPAVGVTIAGLLLTTAFGLAQTLAARIDPAAPAEGMLLLTWLSNTGLAKWINESESIFGYPGILFLHTLGLAMVVGISAAIDMRLLGVASRIPATALARLFPYVWWGFSINAVSGLLLFIASARRTANPLFEVKLALVALGIAAMSLIQRELSAIDDGVVPKSPTPRKLRWLAAASLIVWLIAIAAGRLVAYVHGN
jgi:hypothetical protein